MIPPSRAAAIILGLSALILAYIVWIAFYRRYRIEALEEQLQALRDRAFDAALTSGADLRASLDWLERVAAAAGDLTPTRFLLARAAGAQPTASDTSTADTVIAEALEMIRRHLVLGFWPLWWTLRPGQGSLSALVVEQMMALGVTGLRGRRMGV